jgi:HNH endonuclease
MVRCSGDVAEQRKNMSELYIPQSQDKLSARLKFLHAKRKKFARASRRLSLSGGQRSVVLGKTAGRCHLCGGKIIDARFAADHVLSHVAGGSHEIDNYLAAHGLCNGCRWFYAPEEFQWILKMGVWARKQIEDGTGIGKTMANRFLQHEQARMNRRVRR